MHICGGGGGGHVGIGGQSRLLGGGHGGHTLGEHSGFGVVDSGHSEENIGNGAGGGGGGGGGGHRGGGGQGSSNGHG